MRAFWRDEGQPVRQIGNTKKSEKVMELQVEVAEVSKKDEILPKKTSSKIRNLRVVPLWAE